ncbi:MULTISPECIES: beta-ketoacyl synthase [unclassified Saccharopolyspora]|uniref:beta-ketoacyl-[acyl-carrier-protein] synthase family protein n=1 Tax=unclassified Saccharopolyspora TaxID=2646250 RepID=UPI001CD55951|nr:MULTISPECIES: beta-ketoacyl-[acyl-carrier-protein] synthase family protein [unclassified Saccharopolyspora]MCA1187918.1 beta-ketoacyl-[acyl-carrier-protein] synthase family protein [Saccharopolyspora sp. 6T]MCA1226404.1 beta-ketoacyl-[acyl-carrier-protein] synthase family protein [Saccharopolyspora sp. 6M]MCA1279154.1 beta-ketoacyl-[acyl-carrier-protein] synthase family protein [Saccharopolyspora sp. 7B]
MSTGDRRVVLTGMGVRAPGGDGAAGFWDLLTSDRTATRTITAFDPAPFRSRIAAEVDFDPVAEGFTAREVAERDRVVLLAIACARDAVRDCGLDLARRDPTRTAVSIGSAVGSTISLDRDYRRISRGGSTWLVDHALASPRSRDHQVPAALARDVAREVAAEGPVAVISTGCTSGLDAVGHGAELIRDGRADVVLAGAADAPISPITVACFDAIRATSPNNADPAHASRPFDRRRDGFVLGEGAAVFVLEERAAALRRCARVHAEFAGFAGRCNAFHMTGLHPEGRELSWAITAALRASGRGRVDYLNAHGSGTKQNDRHETAAIKRSLGAAAHRIPISSIKSKVGHSLGAIGSVELAACVLAMRHGVVPPTANYAEPDPECDLDYVPGEPREADLDVVLSVGSGFGGFQSAVVLTRGDR